MRRLFYYKRKIKIAQLGSGQLKKTNDCQQYRRMENPRNSPDIGQVWNRGEKPDIGDTICGEYPDTRFEEKFRSANQMDGISIAGGRKIADS